MTTAAVARTKLANPFPGLRPFREEEEYLFFGRESQVDTMVDKLAVSKFLAVVGTSGSGKSSLVNCGLRPALSRGLMARAGSNWRMVQFRPGGGPIKALSRALAEPGVLFADSDAGGPPLEEIVEANLLLSKMALVDIYEQAQLPPECNFLVVVDQFEELFRFRALYSSTEEDRATAFVNLLLEAERSPYPIYVALTMRSDFLGDCAQFEGLPEAINRGEYLVPRMTREERRRAITGPVHVGEGEISPVLLTRLLNDVGDNPDQLSIMQHALNRTWARWQNEGGGESVLSLQHYEAVGTMAHALDRHADKAFNELDAGRAQTVCKKIFQALTDKGTDARGVRRPTRMSELCAITEATPEEVTSVVEVFRKPSRSFLMPPAGEKLESDTVLDISHESLMRVWKRLHDWVEDEAQSAAQYIRLVENANRQMRLESGLLNDPELSLMLKWRERRKPNAAWAKRYNPEFDGTMLFLERSRMARDAILAVAEHERKQELRRTRMAAAVLGVLFLLALLTAIYAFMQRSGRLQAELLKEKQEKLTATQIQLYETEKKAKTESDALNGQLSAALKAEEAANKAEKEARERAEKAEAETARNAKIFMEAMQAQAAAQRASAVQFEKMTDLQRDTDSKKDAATIAKDRRELEAARKEATDRSTAAAQKSGQAFAILGAAKNVSTDQMSKSDLFDIASEAKVTASEPGTKNPTDMFSGANGSADRATRFADEQPVGYPHWIEWQTKTTTTIKSVGVYAAHRPQFFRRAFSNFKLFAKEHGEWLPLAEYNPALPYGGSCAKKPCVAPDVDFDPGTVLAVCVNISKPVAAQEYRAEFAQAVIKAEGSSGPLVLQLDGFAKANCVK